MALSNVKGLDKRADRLDVKLGDSDGVCKKHMAIAPVKHTKVPMILALLYQQHASNFSNLRQAAMMKMRPGARLGIAEAISGEAFLIPTNVRAWNMVTPPKESRKKWDNRVALNLRGHFFFSRTTAKGRTTTAVTKFPKTTRNNGLTPAAKTPVKNTIYTPYMTCAPKLPETMKSSSQNPPLDDFNIFMMGKLNELESSSSFSSSPF